ncbi:MAG: alpha/beta hydrolase [Methylobacteriaceae bacterium]|nr:alpha/beta hydrolase [Methylobacteriaceae bacterium]
MAARDAWPIYKGFVSVNGKALHYVRRGEGPALILLHAAPCSARVMEPLQAEWAAHFATFAFDLPGFGLSELPDVEPLTTADLADAIAAAARQLGLSNVTLYGRHTGAGVAVEIARRHPELCHFVLTDGFPVFAAPYSDARLSEYLPPITPQWDGGHLTWAWFRYREQHMFWPWDRPTLAHRADTDVPDLDFLYRGATELLTAADTYADVYASAFRHAGLAVIDEVKVPICYGNRPGDSQFRTVQSYPGHVRVRVFSRDPVVAAAEELKELLAHRHDRHAPAGASRTMSSGADLRGYVDLPDGAVHVRGAGLDRNGAPTLFVPDLPGGLDLHDDEIRSLAQDRPVIAFDPWGNGHSIWPAQRELSVALWAAQAEQLAQQLGWRQARIVGHGAGAVVALEAMRRAPALFTAAMLRSPPALPRQGLEAFAADYAPDIAPAWDGGNFLRLWHHLRDQELWFPWNCRTRLHARDAEPRIDPRWLHARAVLLLRQPAHYRAIWRHVLLYPTLEILSALRGRVAVSSCDGDLFARCAAEAAAAAGAPWLPQ